MGIELGVAGADILKMKARRLGGGDQQACLHRTLGLRKLDSPGCVESSGKLIGGLEGFGKASRRKMSSGAGNP